MTIKSADVVAAIGRAAIAARKSEDELNAADSKLGDGDTGLMLHRWLTRISNSAPDDQDDLGLLFAALASESGKATGSSLGSLGTIGLLTMARELEGRTELEHRDLGVLLEKMRDAMLDRSGAKLGDKTVVDIVDRVAIALCGLDEGQAPSARALLEAEKTIDAFKSRPSKVGRARMFADKSMGLDDPGMLAAVRLIEAICAPQQDIRTDL